MCKLDYFNKVLAKVCELSELTTSEVCHSNREECVDARYLTIAVLSERMSDRQISEISGWSYQLVNKARNAFTDRCKFRWGLKEMYKELIIFVS